MSESQRAYDASLPSALLGPTAMNVSRVEECRVNYERGLLAGRGDLPARLAAVTAERDAAIERVDVLQQALNLWGRHSDWCAALGYAMPYTEPALSACSCGLGAALDAKEDDDDGR